VLPYLATATANSHFAALELGREERERGREKEDGRQL